MILYFSGTGNSRAIAERTADLLDEKVLAITDSSPKEINYSGESLGIVFPTYSWGVPPIVIDYISHLNDIFIEEAKLKSIWIIAVCGDEVAYAPEMIEKRLNQVGLHLNGGWSVQMPNNYVILPGFDVDSKDLETEKLKAWPEKTKQIANKIKCKNWEKCYVRGSWPRLKSGVIYPLFKKWGIFPSKWEADDKCIGCGKCEMVCPVRNVTMHKTGQSNSMKVLLPRWGQNCTSCLACFHICPRHAINYGKATRKKGQYFFPR